MITAVINCLKCYEDFLPLKNSIYIFNSQYVLYENIMGSIVIILYIFHIAFLIFQSSAFSEHRFSHQNNQETTSSSVYYSLQTYDSAISRSNIHPCFTFFHNYPMWLLQKVHIPLPQIFPLIENPPSPTLPVPPTYTLSHYIARD